MAKTLRVRTKDGWVTKPVEDTIANRLTAEEIDDNLLDLESQIENIDVETQAKAYAIKMALVLG